MSLDNMLNRKCTIQKKIKTVDSLTGQSKETWYDYKTNVSCTKRTLKGDERLISGKESLIATDMFYFKYGLTLDEDNYQIIFEGYTYNILSVGDAAVRRHHLEVRTEVIR